MIELSVVLSEICPPPTTIGTQARQGDGETPLGGTTPKGEELTCGELVEAFARCADKANAEIFKTKLDA